MSITPAGFARLTSMLLGVPRTALGLPRTALNWLEGSTHFPACVVCVQSRRPGSAFKRPLTGLGLPTVLALEGGYNASVTSACVDAVVRAMLGERHPSPPPKRLGRCCEPTLRAVLRTQQPHRADLLGSSDARFDQYFRAAAEGCVPERASKRARKQ